MYEIEAEKLSKPPKRINLSLSLIRSTTNESRQEASTARHVKVNAVSSLSNQTEVAAFGPNSVLREDYNNGKVRINQLHMTRVAKKVAAVRVSYHMHIDWLSFPSNFEFIQATSYDFAETNGPFYMP